MKATAIVALISLGFLPFGFAQDTTSSLAAPTESYGCEPHGDHFHCEGHVSELSTTVSVPEATATNDDHDHDHDEDHDHDHSDGTETPGPSPTNSIGCEPHGDHWHCDGVRETTTPGAIVTSDESAGPSPTESVGCEPHGDHWHCDGPAETKSDASPSSTDGAGDDDSGAMAGFIPLAGVLAAAAMAM
ncbi:hypothetical protein N3K66_008646 [Trichothecium roseum]|uniref:Uncharacterized protein n=1 Tax=Trichothecium roseum TaxID=47278 RepID=A0ACC0USJ0_9HYPO|nr:hypothetical protein N3K66_008646 [Trichothecium roseum]